ncbi:lysophosphatidate acyltransferase [Pelomyxa schiedti]|nr:lysophosphatidate acyltransferase [Pelomyxa schiedti]
MNLMCCAFCAVFVGCALLTQIAMIAVLPYTLLFDRKKRSLEYRIYWLFSQFVVTRFWTVKLLSDHDMSDSPVPCVIVCNHQSVWDQAFCYLLNLGVKPRAMIKNSIRWFPVFNFSGLILDVVYVGADKQLNELSMAKCAELLKNGIPLNIFPEGTRRFLQEASEKDDHPHIGKFRDGAFKLACDAGVPVVPVAMELRHLTDDSTLDMHPGTMYYYVCKPIETKGRKIQDVRDEARASMIAAYDHLLEGKKDR